VVQLSQSHGSFAEAYLWKLVAAEFALTILSDGLTRSIALTDGLLGDRFANHTSVRIMEHAACGRDHDLALPEQADQFGEIEAGRRRRRPRLALGSIYRLVIVKHDPQLSFQLPQAEGLLFVLRTAPGI
jgi:ATP-binding cassette subfamily B protein